MTDRGTPPEYPEGVATCDNCGWVEHTTEQMAECVSSMLGDGPWWAEDEEDLDDEGNPVILSDEPPEYDTLPNGRMIRVNPTTFDHERGEIF